MIFPPGPIVSEAWLAGVRSPGIVVVDATIYLPNEGKDAAALFEAAHIPGARFFDLDRVVDPAATAPHMLPPAADFAAAVGALGIGNGDAVIVYDQRGIFSAARLWWMFRVFGHAAVAVLDGGLPGWVAAGGAVEAGVPVVEPAHFVADFRPEFVRALADMRANLHTGAELVLDARAAGRFHGTVPEPRAGMRGGHIPGAVSVPFTELLQDGLFLAPPEILRARFAAAGVGPQTRVVTSCGSGVTAAVLTLGLAVAGLPAGALYDGSWSEWGAAALDTPVEV